MGCEGYRLFPALCLFTKSRDAEPPSTPDCGVAGDKSMQGQPVGKADAVAEGRKVQIKLVGLRQRKFQQQVPDHLSSMALVVVGHSDFLCVLNVLSRDSRRPHISYGR